jgi:polysaccharide biosynthesis transport protein
LNGDANNSLRPPPTANGGPAATPGLHGSAPQVLSWQVVRKYWPTALATFVAVLVGVVFYTLGQTKIYEATSTVLFDPNPPRPLGPQVETVVDLGAGNSWDNREYYETQYSIIRSMSVALAVVNDLGLQNDAGFVQNLPPGAKPGRADRVSPELAAEILRGRLVVQPIRDSRLANVKLLDADPARAQRVLAAIMDTYVAQNLATALDATNTASDWLRTQLDKLKTDLESSELELHRYKKDKDILSVQFDDQSNMLREEMKSINEELTHARALLQEATARSTELNAASEDDPGKITSSELLKSSLLTALRQDYERAKRQRDGLLGSGKGENHPEVAAANREVETAKAAILKEIRNIKTAVHRDAGVLQRQVGGLAGMMEGAKGRAHELNLLEIEYNRLKRNKENTEKLYSLVLERTKESDLARMMRVNNIRVIDRPLLPRAPVSPRVPLNLGVGMVAGMLLGVFAAFVRGQLDRTVKVPEDIEEELGLAFLGLVPAFSEATTAPVYARRRGRRRPDPSASKPQLIVHEQPTSGTAEAARAIRTNLMFMAPDNPYRTLLVTSPGPGEGKTTVACCIAIAMAQAGQRVVLVDCDLRRPRIHRIFGKSSEFGVSTALIDGRYDDVVQETEVPNLSVIPCGPVPPNPAELFHSDRFKALLRRVSETFDRVIIDSPPVAAVTDPTILSTLVDGTVLVARASGTRKELAHHAVRSISGVGGKIAGAVLNAVDFSRLEYRYSYYRYYKRDAYYYGTKGNQHDSGAETDEAQDAELRASN